MNGDKPGARSRFERRVRAGAVVDVVPPVGLRPPSVPTPTTCPEHPPCRKAGGDLQRENRRPKLDADLESMFRDDRRPGDALDPETVDVEVG